MSNQLVKHVMGTERIREKFSVRLNSEMLPRVASELFTKKVLTKDQCDAIERLRINSGDRTAVMHLIDILERQLSSIDPLIDALERSDLEDIAKDVNVEVRHFFKEASTPEDQGISSQHQTFKTRASQTGDLFPKIDEKESVDNRGREWWRKKIFLGFSWKVKVKCVGADQNGQKCIDLRMNELGHQLKKGKAKCYGKDGAQTWSFQQTSWDFLPTFFKLASNPKHAMSVTHMSICVDEAKMLQGPLCRVNSVTTLTIWGHYFEKWGKNTFELISRFFDAFPRLNTLVVQAKKLSFVNISPLINILSGKNLKQVELELRNIVPDDRDQVLEIWGGTVVLYLIDKAALEPMFDAVKSLPRNACRKMEIKFANFGTLEDKQRAVDLGVALVS